jgi:hypothetical protein
MSECDFMREAMPLLLTESLDPVRREQTHQHIERCSICNAEWDGYRQTWRVLGDMPEVEVPARVRERFMTAAGLISTNVVPFRRRLPLKWIAQAAAVAVIAGGSYMAGHRAPVTLQPTPATDAGAQVRPIAATPAYAIAESSVYRAAAINPDIQGRPDIDNVTFTNVNPNGEEIGVSFDITQRVTVTGKPTDKSMVRLLRYVLENEDKLVSSRARTIDWVRSTYSRPGNADPEIANALANVLRNDDHQGVRIKAVDTLKSIPSAMGDDTRSALIEALKSDPNPAVRIKAVEALANLARKGAVLDEATLDTLRQKATQNDENAYVRIKASELLTSIRPE